MAILATAPIFMDQAGGVGIDLPFTAFIVLALAALATWRDTQLNRWLLIAALLAGSACGIRHTGVLTSVLLGVGVLMIAPEQRMRERIRGSISSAQRTKAGPVPYPIPLALHSPLQFRNQLLVPLPARRGGDAARVLARDAHLHREAVVGQGFDHAVGPLDDGDAVAEEHLVGTQRCHVLRPREPVGVAMIHRKPSRVLMDEDEAGALAFLQERILPKLPEKGTAGCDSTRLNPYLHKPE